jgi:hypothetical protein
VRTLQRHNREMARATAEAAESVVVRVATVRLGRGRGECVPSRR